MKSTTPQYHIGRRIKTRRKELGLTQDELAARLGYTGKATISKIETGINDVAATKIEAFAKALDCDPEYLLGLSSKPRNPERIMRFHAEPQGNSEEIKEMAGTAAKAAKNLLRSLTRKRADIVQQILDDGADVIFDAYTLAPDKLTDYARMICMTSGDRRHLATAAHSSASKVPQEDLDMLDED